MCIGPKLSSEVPENLKSLVFFIWKTIRKCLVHLPMCQVISIRVCLFHFLVRLYLHFL